MTEIRNILLIGRTGSGKSTIANVLVNQVDQEGKFIGEFQEIFKEGEGATSQTREIQEKEMKINGVNYWIIDTVGIGDTRLNEKQVLNELKDKVSKLNNLNQILFVVGASKKFEKGDVETFNHLRKHVFDGDREIVKFITIVRTNFSGFAKLDRCEKDIENMANEGGEIAKIIELCEKKVIHVNNSTEDDDDSWMEKRNESRKILINHLKTCQEVYKPKPKVNKTEENQKVSHYSGTFNEAVFDRVKTGDYANFGKVGVQNFKEIQTQHNYQEGSSKRKSFQGHSVTINPPSLAAKQILEETKKELQIKLREAEVRVLQDQLNEKPLPLTPPGLAKLQTMEQTLADSLAQLRLKLSNHVNNPIESLNILLEIQTMATKLQELPGITLEQLDWSKEKLNRAKSTFLNSFNNEKEINELCRLQAEVTKLKNKLKVKNTEVVELEEQLQTSTQVRILHQPYGIPGSN